MDFELKRIIEIFNAAQERAVAVLESNFECQRPETSKDFILRCVPVIREVNYEKGGYKIRPHGIGMEVNVDGTKIDFDFGMNGEFNGFDAWRLSEFVRSNNIKSDLRSEDDFKNAIDNAVKSNEIVKSAGIGSIFYVNS